MCKLERSGSEGGSIQNWRKRQTREGYEEGGEAAAADGEGVYLTSMDDDQVWRGQAGLGRPFESWKMSFPPARTGNYDNLRTGGFFSRGRVLYPMYQAMPAESVTSASSRSADGAGQKPRSAQIFLTWIRFGVSPPSCLLDGRPSDGNWAPTR